MSAPLVLASSSPRRQDLLRLIGLTFETVPADIDESWRNGEAPATHAERLAREKASSVRRPGAAVVGADTIVVIDGAILGKPRDADDAAAMLRRLAGRDHLVHTAVAVAYRDRLVSAVETTKVRMGAMDEATIATYVATGEPLDKAGAYGIQGFGAVLVERIDGDYFTVMGLGLFRLVTLLAEVGLTYRFGRLEADGVR